MFQFLKSIRFKIILWYMLILGSTMFIFGVVFYHQYKVEITSDFDDLLRSNAEGIVGSISTYWETERLEATQQYGQDISPEQFLKRGNSNFVKIAQRWVEEEGDDSISLNVLIRIYDADGRNVAYSNKLSSIPQLPRELYQAAQRRETPIKEESIKLSNNKDTVVRTLTVGVFESKDLAYIIQVSSPLNSVNNALSNLSWLLLIFLPTTVILTSIAGAFLARQTLRPVNQMTATIHQITAENLKLRINLPNTKDEIQALAITFNEMIARLDESFTSQRQFMEDISHELKTPLSILKGELEVTLKRLRSTQEYELILNSSLEEVNRLTRIVENLLTLARFDTKTVVMETSPVDICTLISLAIEDIDILAQQKGVIINFSPNENAIINADKAQIKRLILNLLDNAIKYTPTGGAINITLNHDRENIKITIADSGIGIPQEELSHIFDRFYRIDKSRSSSGFGLGLSIAQSIAQVHGGAITAQANHPAGTSFLISLPLNRL